MYSFKPYRLVADRIAALSLHRAVTSEHLKEQSCQYVWDAAYFHHCNSNKYFMGCSLSIAGKELDIDAFILKSGLEGYIKNYRKFTYVEQVAEGKKYSFVSTDISDADANSFDTQVSDAINYLEKNYQKLLSIKTTKEIKFATLNFLIELNSVSNEYFAQYIYLPKELTILCGELNIGIEMTIIE